jgi:hypothetical protein
MSEKEHTPWVFIFSRSNQQPFLQKGSQKGTGLVLGGSDTYLGRLFAFSSKFTGIEETMTAPWNNTKKAIKTLRNTPMVENKALL